MNGLDADRVHQATPRRREQARSEGNIPLSRDLTAAVKLLAFCFAILSFAPATVHFLAKFATQQLSIAHVNPTPQFWIDDWMSVQSGLAKTLLPALAIALAVAVAAHLVQTRFQFRASVAMPDFQRASPSRGLQRIFSGRSIADGGLGMIKALIIVGVAFGSLAWDMEKLVPTTDAEPPQIAANIVAILQSAVLRIAVALLALAVADYFFQRWRWERAIRMTTQELRDEIKSQEGHPEITARRRRVHRQLIPKSQL